MVELSASLLAADYANLAQAVSAAQTAGVDRFHLDFMDGHYVPNLALTPTHLTDLRPYSNIPLDVHLELANPDQILAAFPEMNADEITVQFDTAPDLSNTFSAIKAQNAKVGLGINPDTPLESIYSYLPKIDTLVILGVMPGFGGQTIYPDTTDRVSAASEMRQQTNTNFQICVDGGVKLENAEQLILAGADILIMGTGFFQAKDMTETVSQIKAIKA